jgi:hypothetical protein
MGKAHSACHPAGMMTGSHRKPCGVVTRITL